MRIWNYIFKEPQGELLHIFLYLGLQAKHHLTEEKRKKVAHAMGHDPTMAERFYVALQDKKMDYKTRKLRMKALKSAAEKNLQEEEEEEDSDESSFLETEPTEDTPTLTSDDEEPVYDDQSDSPPSLSSEEKLRMIERRKKGGVEVLEPEDSSSKDEPPMFQAPEPPRSKKKLHFPTEPERPFVKRKRSPLVEVSPSKCYVSVERMKKSTLLYYLFKRASKVTKQEAGERSPVGGGGEEILGSPEIPETPGRGQEENPGSPETPVFKFKED